MDDEINMELEREFARKLHADAITERHDVLCGCGWGRLAMPESEIPSECPMCGREFPWS